MLPIPPPTPAPRRLHALSAGISTQPLSARGADSDITCPVIRSGGSATALACGLRCFDNRRSRPRPVHPEQLHDSGTMYVYRARLLATASWTAFSATRSASASGVLVPGSVPSDVPRAMATLCGKMQPCSDASSRACVWTRQGARCHQGSSLSPQGEEDPSPRRRQASTALSQHCLYVLLLSPFSVTAAFQASGGWATHSGGRHRSRHGIHRRQTKGPGSAAATDRTGTVARRRASRLAHRSRMHATWPVG